MNQYLHILLLCCVATCWGRISYHDMAEIERHMLGTLRKPIMALTRSILDNELGKYTRTIQEQQSKIQALEGNLDALKSLQQEKSIAFYVMITVSTKAEVLRFNRIHTNDGNGYDNSTGKFTCPAAGTYHFVWSVEIENNSRGYVLVDLEVNGIDKGFTLTVGPKKYSSTGSVILRLNQGDEVWIEKREMAHIAVGPYQTTFSGHFLYAKFAQ